MLFVFFWLNHMYIRKGRRRLLSLALLFFALQEHHPDTNVVDGGRRVDDLLGGRQMRVTISTRITAASTALTVMNGVACASGGVTTASVTWSAVAGAASGSLWWKASLKLGRRHPGPPLEGAAE
jgi:hypothetical protein